MKRKIAHIINPFIASEGSDLAYAQPITFQTMLLAKNKAETIMDIELLAAAFPEDEKIIPSYFKKTSFLEKSVLGFNDFQKKIKLPCIAEILQKAFEESEADYIIYSNADIGLYPDFYLTVNTLIDEDFDAVIINRKRLKPKYTKVEEIDRILLQEGKSHPGFDCFVFHRSIYPKLVLENICIGVPFIEITLSQNLFHLSNKFKLIESARNTFHIGMEIFKNRAPKEYVKFNRIEFRRAICKLDPFLKSKNLPYSHLILPLRIIKWGLHPCIPIKLALGLEIKRWFGRKN